VVVVLDRLTKWWAVGNLSDGPMVIVDDWFQLRLLENSGASFGMLDGAGSYIAFGALIAVVIIGLVVHKLESGIESAAMGLVLGGAVGNLIDRIFRGDGLFDGSVIDFIDINPGFNFPTFNIADSAITIGAILAVSIAIFRKPA